MDAFTEHYRFNVNNELVPKIVCSLCTQLYCVKATLWRILHFPSQRLLLLRQTTGRRKKRKRLANKYRKSETEYTQRMFGLLHEEKGKRKKTNNFPSLFIQSHAFVGYCSFFMFIRTNILPPWFLVLFS